MIKRENIPNYQNNLIPRKMKTIALNYKLSNGLFLIVISPLLSNSLQAETYASKANGTWTSASAWQGGIVPANGSISSGTIINIKQIVYYPGSNVSNKEGINTLRLSIIKVLFSIVKVEKKYRFYLIPEN